MSAASSSACASHALLRSSRRSCYGRADERLDRLTSRIEELAMEAENRIILCYGHANMQQAARISDKTAFFLTGRYGRIRPDGEDSPCRMDRRTKIHSWGGLADAHPVWTSSWKLPTPPPPPKLIELGALCEDAISASLSTRWIKMNGNQCKARKWAGGRTLEREIDLQASARSRAVYEAPALQQQPVARDLAARSPRPLKMISDLERNRRTRPRTSRASRATSR